MALGDKGTIFVGSRQGDKVYALVDHGNDGVADDKYILLQGMNMPNFDKEYAQQYYHGEESDGNWKDVWSFTAVVDGNVTEINILADGTLEKLSPGLYYVPKKTVFGAAPPDEEALVRSFLKDDDFLLTSPNAYNGLGVGTTQLYNRRVVYNHKRHGEFKLGGRTFFFHARHRFPKTLTKEFLLVDLVNNLGNLAEDQGSVLKNVAAKAQTMDAKKLKQSVTSYGNARTKVFFAPLLKHDHKVHSHAS
jgi:hypothetical protein